MTHASRSDDLRFSIPVERSDRFYVENGEWFYTTRENLAIGPYPSQTKARQGLDAYLEYMGETTLTPSG
ncbi:DUF6316 family protein [Hahella ganghwensis]|uniref:DUF6316 family protein n=1 Tax=Hahella ganghwensis TaxID=286420 RepID=UPI0003717FB4|nr:DUF6316 family protein [Hahella ganghwensis]